MIVQEAFKRVDQGEFPVSLFQTTLPQFYEKLGAVEVKNRFVNSKNNDAPNANPWTDDHVMIYGNNSLWPEGQIDLNGKDY